MAPPFIALTDTTGWHHGSLGLPVDLHAVVWAFDRYHAFGDTGIMATSADGKTWALSRLPIDEDIHAAIFADNTLLIAGDKGRIMLSRDGQDWRNYPTRKNIDFTGVTYHKGEFHLCGRNGEVVSCNIEKFSQVQLGDGDLKLYGITAAGRYLYAVGDDQRFVYCTENRGWKGSAISSALATKSFNGLCTWRGQIYIACDKGILFFATPEQRLFRHHYINPRTPPPEDDLLALAPAPYSLAMAGRNGLYALSLDGVVWHYAKAPHGKDLHAITYGNGRFLAVGKDASISLSPPMDADPFAGWSNLPPLAPRADGRPTLCLIAPCKNEAALLPFFLRHYADLADRIVLFDNGSTDATREIAARHPNVTLIPFDTEGRLRDDVNIAIKNTAPNALQLNADWYLTIDADEFLYHPHFNTHLRQLQQQGITLPRIKAFNMFAPAFPQDDGKTPLTALVKTGIYSEAYSNNVLHHRDVHINYALHTISNHTGTCVRDKEPELLLLHYKNLGPERIGRPDWYQLSEANIRGGWGTGSRWGKDYVPLRLGPEERRDILRQELARCEQVLP